MTECIEMTPVGSVLVHQKCHRNFTDHKRVMHRGEEVAELPCKKRLSSSFYPFNWKEDCMLCGKCTVVGTCHPDRAQVKVVTTLPMQDNILEQCSRRGDDWALTVQKSSPCMHRFGYSRGCISLKMFITIYVKQRARLE